MLTGCLAEQCVCVDGVLRGGVVAGVAVCVWCQCGAKEW